MSDMTVPRHIFLTAILCAIPLGVCLITQDLGIVVDVLGTFCSSTLGYTFPPALYIGSHKMELRDILYTQKVSNSDSSDSNSSVPLLWGKLCTLKFFFASVVSIMYGSFVLVAGLASLFTW